VHTGLHELLCISLSALCLLVQSLNLAFLIKRKLRTAFPIFFNYTAYCVLSISFALVPYFYWTSQYFYIYWILNALNICFEFGIMYEIFVNALKPYSAIIDLGKLLFRWAAAFLLVAALLTAFAANGSQPSKIFAGINLVERSVRLMQCGLLLLFFVLERRLGLSWRSRTMSIALGLGIYSSCSLVTTYLVAHYPTWYATIGPIDTAIYLGVVTFWAYCLRLPEPARKTVLDSPSKLIFQRWNEVLMASPFSGTPGMAMAPADPFLPGVEKTVDRILARKMVS